MTLQMSVENRLLSCRTQNIFKKFIMRDKVYG
jgi:hypothetical protein